MGWLDKYEKAQTGKKLKRSAAEETRSVSKDRINSVLSKIPTEETVKQIRHNKIQQKLNTRSEVTPHIPQSPEKKMFETFLNPMTAFGYVARGQDIPDNFSRGERNATDYALDVINPIHYIDAAKDVGQGIATGDLMQTGVGALGVLPLALDPKLVTKPLQNIYKINPLANRTPNMGRLYQELGAQKPNWLTGFPSGNQLQEKLSNLSTRSFSVGSDFDIESLRRAYHNSERFLLPQETQALHKKGYGAPSNYRDDNLISNASTEQLDRWMRIRDVNNQLPPVPQQLRLNLNTDWSRPKNVSNSKELKNRSGLTKEQILQRAPEKNKDVISKISDSEFQNTVFKPTGELDTYVPGLDVSDMTYNIASRRRTLKDAIPISDLEYQSLFNERLDLLNEIIAKNNTSGVNYSVKGLENNILKFSSPGNPKMNIPPSESSWAVNVNPARWAGEVKNISNSDYYKAIPGLDMSSSSLGLFPQTGPVKGTAAYKSINEYLKKLDLGRVKPGFNSQTQHSRGLWDSAIKKNNAVGFYDNPSTIFGSMKTLAPYLTTGAGLEALSQTLQSEQPQQQQLQDGGVLRGSKEYEKAYREGTFADVANPLEPITITADKKTGKNILDHYPNYYNLSETDRKHFNDKGPIGRAIRRRGYTNKDLSQDTTDFVNPILYGIAGSMLSAPLIAGSIAGLSSAGMAAAPFLEGAMATALPGLSSIPGATVGNALIAGGVGLSTNEIVDPQSATRQSINTAIDEPTFGNIAKATGNSALTATGFILPNYGAGMASMADDAMRAGKYLTTQTPLKNTYKLNSNALKEAQEQMLVRARPVGQDPFINDAARFEKMVEEGKPLTHLQKTLLQRSKIKLDSDNIANIHEKQKYFGQWFADNPSDLDFYINPGTRNFADDAQIEILKARMPKSEAAKYSVKNFEDAKKLSNLHDAEYILPKDMVQKLERYSVDDLSRLQKEHKDINTPHWLKGFPKATSVDDVGKSLMKTSSVEDVATQFKNNFANPGTDIIDFKNIKTKYRYDGEAASKELKNLLNIDSFKNNLKQQNSGNLKNHLKALAKEDGLDMNVYNKLIDDLDVNKLDFHTEEKLKLAFDKAASQADEYFAHMGSSKMQKKLKDFSDEYGVDLVEEYKKHKAVFDKNKKDMIRFDYGSPTDEIGSYGVDFELAMGKNSKLPMYESNRINLNPSLINNEEELQKTIWHELSHSFNRKIKNNPKILKELDDIFYTDISSIPKEKINKTWIEDFQTAKLDNLANEQVTYLNKPEEVWSHLSTNLKQALKKEGLINDFYEPITLEHLDKIKSSAITDYLPLIKDKSKLLKFINKMTLGVTGTAIGAEALMNQEESTPQQQFKNGGWLDKYQDGGNIPKRKGVRKNEDGSESTHLMRAEKLNDSTWVGFPTLFQNPDASWMDMSQQAEKDWMPVYQEALKRNEVRNFGRDSIGALKYGEGSWKPKKLQDGGVIEDDRGQWAHPGKVTKINSNNITMQGVDYPVLGVSNTGDRQLMLPGMDYKFKGDNVTEYPMAQDGKKLYVESKNDPRYQSYGAMEQKPKSGGKSPIYVDSPGDHRLHKYLDSLNLYKGHQAQLKFNPEISLDDSLRSSQITKNHIEGFENLVEKGEFFRVDDKFPDIDYWASEEEFIKDNPLEIGLINAYKDLNFSEKTDTGLWRTPDLSHASINPISIYYGGTGEGNALNPVFKKPTQPIEYSGNFEDVLKHRSTPNILGTSFIFNPEKKVNSYQRPKQKTLTLPQTSGLKTSEQSPEFGGEMRLPMNRGWNVTESVQPRFGGNVSRYKTFDKNRVDYLQGKAEVDKASVTGQDNSLQILPDYDLGGFNPGGVEGRDYQTITPGTSKKTDRQIREEKARELKSKQKGKSGISIKNKNNLHNFTQANTSGWLDKYN